MSRTAITLTLDACEQALLEKISRQLTVPDYKEQRVRTVLAAATGLHNKDIALLVGLTRRAVSKWRKRWSVHHQQWQQSDPALRPKMNTTLVLCWLADQKGRGRKATITLEQRSKIAGLCQETPEQNNIPVTHWTLNHLVDASVKSGIIDKISRTSVHRILKKTTCRLIGVDTG